MSKSLKKLIDINRLREFKNKLVGTDSAYVQTAAVDQTVAGTKTFSKPIVGSVTGSSGSCTGNAATATKLQTARTINGTSFNGTANITTANWGTARNITITDGTNTSTAVSVNGSANVSLTLPATIKANLTGNCSGSSGSCTGNAATATTATSVPWNGVTGKPSSYTPAAHTQAASTITGLAKVATSGSYTDLANKPAIPTVNNATLTIQKNGTTVKTFTANASANVTANITVPTKVSELTNDSGFLTSHQSLSNYVTLNGAQTISGAKTFTGDVIGINKHGSTEDANSLYSTTAGSKLTYYTISNGGTTLTNIPAAVNTTLESRTIRRLSDSDWIVEQICHNSNGLYYRKGSNGTWGAWKTFAFTDSNISGNAATATTATTAKACTGNAATATKLATARSLWGNNFDGSAAITGKIMGTPAIELMPPEDTSNNGGNLDFHYNRSTADYTSRIIESASGTLSINNVTITTGKVVTATTFNGALKGDVTGNCSGSSGSCTGNAATATKLAAKRTIALSGAATGTATGFDGSGNITIPVTALASSAIRAQWYAAYPDGAEAHNSMWGGRDITAAFNNGTVSANIANGTFRDIFPGDYITKQVTISGTTYTVNWVMADCDYWWHKGNQNNGMERHHVAIVPQVPIFNSNMNPTNKAEGGYAGSRMYRETIPACATGIMNAFGSDHILTFRDFLTRDLNTSAVSSGITSLTGASNWNGDWYSQECNLMSEAMVYVGPHCASSAYDNIMATRQMSAFRLSERLINYNRRHWWLRDVVSSARFAHVNGHGVADMNDASYVYGVRPFVLLL